MKTGFKILAAACLLGLAMSAHAGVKDSLHNLSTSGSGGVKATAADRICEFCHISHSAGSGAAMWSRGNSTAAYIPYSIIINEGPDGDAHGMSFVAPARR